MEATATAQPPQNIANPSKRIPPKPFTPENARQMQAIAMEKRRANLAQARAEREEMERKLAFAEAIATQPDEVYRLEQLKRVRVRIAATYELMEGEDEPQALDRLASALARLSDIEQKLAGRPSPGSLRPKGAPTKRTSSTVEPLAS